MKLSILPLILLFSFPTFAQTGATGGGNAVVCRDPNHKITSAELLDFFEAKAVQPGMSISKNPIVPFIVQYQKMVTKTLDVYSSVKFPTIRRLTYLIDALSMSGNPNLKPIPLPQNIGLAPLDDSLGFIIPKDCAIERLAYFNNGLDYVDGEIYNELSETDKAGLALHETIYKEFKYSSGDSLRDSRSVRQIVAIAASDNIKFESTLATDDSSQTGEWWLCNGSNFDLNSIYFKNKNEFVFNVLFLKDHTKSWTKIESIILNDIPTVCNLNAEFDGTSWRDLAPGTGNNLSLMMSFGIMNNSVTTGVTMVSDSILTLSNAQLINSKRVDVVVSLGNAFSGQYIVTNVPVSCIYQGSNP